MRQDVQSEPLILATQFAANRSGGLYRTLKHAAARATAIRRVVVVALCIGLVGQSGCQLTRPLPPPERSSLGAFKPQTESTNPAVRTPAVQTASATVRGQSPDGWSTSTAGGGDSYRTPMPPTDASLSNRYNLQPPAQPTSLPTPNPNSNTTVGYPAPAGAPQAPAQGYGYVAPPTTVYQPQVPGYGYGGEFYQPSPSDYNSTVAPGVYQGLGPGGTAIAPGAIPYIDPNIDITAPGGGYQPRQRIAPIDVFVQEARTGRIIVGGSVNSDLGVAGNVVIDERNFDIRRFPRSWDDLWSGRSFRGGGQNFRAELMPGNRVERYTVSWTNRNLFGYLPYSLSVGGFLYTRQFRDWTEQRLGGRVALGYEITKDLSISSEIRLEDVKLFDPRLAGVAELDDALGSNDIYTARVRLAHDTRDSPFMATEGGLLELVFDQVFGEYDFSRGNVNYSRYFLVRERPDGTGRHTIASTWKFGVTGSQTPIFENYFAGGYSTLRGFSFRGASPKVGDVQVGGELMFLGSLEYVFPLTADEMLRGVAFVDYGTVEQDLKINSENFRVAPGLGLRVSVPALGPAPLAFDFAYPINNADSDDRQVFSFFMGFTR